MNYLLLSFSVMNNDIKFLKNNTIISTVLIYYNNGNKSEHAYTLYP